VEWKYTVEDRVDWLSMRNGILDEADVARGGGGVETEVWDWRRLEI